MPAPSTYYDSLLTFECIQKASALRVLAKTLDRQRNVAVTAAPPPSASAAAAASASLGVGVGVAPASAESAPQVLFRKMVPPPPRKLQPIQRRLSGSY